MVLSLVLLTLVISCSCSQGGKEADAATENRMPVETAKVGEGDITQYLVLSGKTEPQNSTVVMPKIVGAEKLVSLQVKTGDKVQAGQVIAVLEQSSVAIQLNTSQLAYDDALKNYEKNKTLYEMGAIAQNAFEQLETAYKQAENNLKVQQLNYDNTIIKAPFKGIVADTSAEVGDLVSGQTKIATIVKVDKLEIKTSINESLVKKIASGDKVKVMIPAEGEQIYQGTIEEISPTMDEMLKAYPLIIRIDNSEGALKAGMYAQVELITDLHEKTLQVPTRAVLKRDGVASVFVLQEGKAVKKEVLTSLSNDDKTEILEGLEAGDEIVIKGNEDLVDGDAVIVVNGGEKA